jgi:hypothetical protein
VAASATGSFSKGSTERSARIDAARHSLGAGQHELSQHPLDSDANTSPDRDADGWTGGGRADDQPAGSPSGPAQQPAAPPQRPRLPDDPRGERLDVTA